MAEKNQWTCCAWRAILVSAFALGVLVCIAISVVLLLTQKPVNLGEVGDAAAWDTGNVSIRRKPAHYRPFTFEDLLSNKQHVRSMYSVKWLADDSLIIAAEPTIPLEEDGASLNIIRSNNFSEELWVPDSEFIAGFTGDLSGERVKFSPSGKYVALSKLLSHGFRHSEDSLYQIAKISDGKLSKYTFVGPKGTGLEAISSFRWNPNPEKHDFIFVSDFNVYYQSDPGAPGSAIALSENGKSFYRYGLADWLYEEEISPSATFWSDRGEMIAYIRYDDQFVHKVYVPKYFNTRQYTDYLEVPYPKAGVQNQPEVTLFLWNVKENKKVVISPPDELMARNLSYYIFSNNFITVAMNGTREEKLLTFCPHQYTDGNIYQHIAHIRVQDDGSGRMTTFHGGTYDVIKLHGYDQEKDTLFYESSGGGIAFKRLFRVRSASTRLAQIQCISCSVPNCDSATISVSPRGKRVALTCNRAFDNGRLYLMNTANNNEFHQLRGFEAPRLAFDEPIITFEKVMLVSKIEAHVGIMRPPKFDPTETYPVLLDVYGGPNSYINSLETPWDFLVYLCSTRQMIVVYIDGRGSKHRGWDVKGPIRNSFGGPEVDDQIDGMRKIIDKYPWMNKKAVAVLGWSYGGFLSTHIGVKDNGNVFRCSLAVAPVSDFLLYDSAYTERYMGLPTENPQGYNSSRLTDKITKMRNVHYLLAHGSADDNVHYHNAALLAGALQENNIPFTQLVYTNQDHSMDDGSGRMTTFHGGTYDVIKLHGYDQEKDTLFYESSGGGIAFKRLFRLRSASTRFAQIKGGK
ncbi:unnamed protein product, partial [Mesorhabditis belari]|uniref:Uncharacterized protein n=1 Tax=Mesorhabditis belari TaxID=2138241 RepID=A0AAF3FJ22_9BILA